MRMSLCGVRMLIYPLHAVGEGREPDMALRNVISTLNHDGTEVMGPGVLMYHYPGNDIMNGSLLTVESNHFCVLKSRGAVLDVYETGQYPVSTPQRPLLGSIQQSFYGGQSPWQYEALFVSRAQERGQVTGSRAVPGARRARLRRGLLRPRGHQGRRGQAGHAHAVPRAPADDGSGQRLRGPGRRAVDQPDRPGHTAGAGEREDPPDHRTGPWPPAGLPHHPRDHDPPREGAHAAQGRADARADLAARVRAYRARGRPLLRGDEDGREGPAVRAEHGDRRAVQHRDYCDPGRPARACAGRRQPRPERDRASRGLRWPMA